MFLPHWDLPCLFRHAYVYTYIRQVHHLPVIILQSSNTYNMTVTYISFLLLIMTTVIASSPNIISRREWGARASKSNQQLKIKPPPYIIIHHSTTPSCSTMAKCKSIVRGIQNYHMDTKKWKDIGYNFLVGGDGNVYEARGWNRHGAHAPSYNSKSIGICLIGHFGDAPPPSVQIQAAKDLIQYGVNNNLISSDYKLLGHRQADITDCPGDSLFGLIQNWPHFWTK